MTYLRSPDGLPFHKLMFQKVPSKESEIERIFMGSTYNELMNNSAHAPATEFLQLIEIHRTYRQNSA